MRTFSYLIIISTVIWSCGKASQERSEVSDTTTVKAIRFVEIDTAEQKTRLEKESIKDTVLFKKLLFNDDLSELTQMGYKFKVSNMSASDEVLRPASFNLESGNGGIFGLFRKKHPNNPPPPVPKADTLNQREIYTLDSLRLKIYKNALTVDSLTDGYQLRITAIDSEAKGK